MMLGPISAYPIGMFVAWPSFIALRGMPDGMKRDS